ncbi:MAG: MFS transporter, partial [Anaerolineales bacterium]|nr:MFS transporter [Anaerolineales bacterium]
FLLQFLFSPFAGVFADRYDRRYVMIASDLLRGLTVLGFLLVREPSQIWLFYLLTVVQFMLSALFIPARTAVLANVVRPEELVTANALDSLTWSTMLAVGAMLGGVATAVFGVNTAFVLDALTFALSAWLIAQVALPKTIKAKRQKGWKRGWIEMAGGWHYLRGEPIMLGLALVKAGGSLVWGAINVLEVNYAEMIYPTILTVGNNVVGGDGTVTLTIIYTLSGLGTGLGPLFVRRWLGDTIPRLLAGITLGFVLLAIGLLGLGLAPTLTVFAVFTVVRTVGTGVLWVFSASLLQMVVPDVVRGRVFAFEFALLTLTQSISIYWAGFAQDTLGWTVPSVTLSMFVLGVFVLGAWLPFYLRIRTRPLLKITPPL